MTQQKNSTVGTGYVFHNSEYFRISKAAEFLTCASEDLLHLGATGKAEILAPVLAEGVYALTLRFLGNELKTEEYFNSASRVLLSTKDLAKIEAQEWVIPKRFYYSSLNEQEFDELLQSCLPNSFDGKLATEMIENWKSNSESISALSDSPMKIIRLSVEKELRKTLSLSWWFAELAPDDSAERTTISDLFITKAELERIKNGYPLNSDSLVRQRHEMAVKHLENKYGNIENCSSIREEILIAAICCKKTDPTMCKDESEWAGKIELDAERFWPTTKVPPLKRDSVNRILKAALNGKPLTQDEP